MTFDLFTTIMTSFVAMFHFVMLLCLEISANEGTTNR